MPRRKVARLALVLVCTALACGSDPSGGDGRDDRFGAGSGKADGGLSDAEIAGVLAVVNALSVQELDDDVGLDRRAADGIVAQRDDDGAFEDLAALDAVPYVGQSALDKLVEYATDNGFVDGDDAAPACLMISEYAEGQGNYNKAIEVWNCGDEAIALAGRSLCLVRNGDHECTVTNEFSDVQLPAGDTWVVCRTLGGTFNDPMQTLRDRCDQEMPGVVLMSGDDRLAVLDRDDTVLDAFGRFSWRPGFEIWADMVLRRCDLAPYLGTAFFTTEGHYTRHSRHDHTNLGIAPTDGC
ncbi:MAG TPA: hypothetical protein VG755_17070 [Nannocystaceae bacterium]|nr:hypothetical protein [Nannocystaceae bacterium]